MAPTEPQLMISLCVLSYIDETPLPNESLAQQQARMLKDINGALSGNLPGWQVAWGPGLSNDRANMMYIAGNTSSNEYAVVIRGTDWSFVLDWLEDFASVIQIAAPYNGSVKIAVGTAVGILALNGFTDPASGKTAMQFLEALPTGAQIYTTGHSLGGCLASAYAPWLVTEGIGTGTMKVYTYAGPSAGDQSFATYFNNMFPGRAVRYYNDIDLVPNAWASLTNIYDLFNPWPTCPTYVKDAIGLVLPYVPAYVQPGSTANGSAVALHGQLYIGKPQDAAAISIGDTINDLFWAYEVVQQHHATYYAQLLGAPAITATQAKAVAFVASKPTFNAEPRISLKQPSA